MAKRKSVSRGNVAADIPDLAEAESGSENDGDTLNVDFEWFDPQPEVDFHGLRLLLRQLLDVDARLFDLSSLTDLILSQPLLGSTVKVEGNETDPYAFLTVVNAYEHREKPVIKSLISYIVAKAKNSAMPQLAELLEPTSAAKVGIILTERLINMPTEVVPPMYAMLLEEISWALEEKEPYDFTHFLVISKTYREVASDIPTEERRPLKKSKKATGGLAESFYFHPEDEVLQKHALGAANYHYSREGDETADSKRAFQELGIRPQGSLILIDATKFKDAVTAVSDAFNPNKQ